MCVCLCLSTLRSNVWFMLHGVHLSTLWFILHYSGHGGVPWGRDLLSWPRVLRGPGRREDDDDDGEDEDDDDDDDE